MTVSHIIYPNPPSLTPRASGYHKLPPPQPPPPTPGTPRHARGEAGGTPRGLFSANCESLLLMPAPGRGVLPSPVFLHRSKTSTLRHEIASWLGPLLIFFILGLSSRHFFSLCDLAWPTPIFGNGKPKFGTVYPESRKAFSFPRKPTAQFSSEEGTGKASAAQQRTSASTQTAKGPAPGPKTEANKNLSRQREDKLSEPPDHQRQACYTQKTRTAAGTKTQDTTKHPPELERPTKPQGAPQRSSETKQTPQDAPNFITQGQRPSFSAYCCVCSRVNDPLFRALLGCLVLLCMFSILTLFASHSTHTGKRARKTRAKKNTPQHRHKTGKNTPPTPPL